MAKITNGFLAAAKSSIFNSSEWNPVGEKVALKDYLTMVSPGTKAESAVVESQVLPSGSIVDKIKLTTNKGDLELPLSGKSLLTDGDTVKVDSIFGQELSKLGRDNIVRWDGEIAE